MKKRTQQDFFEKPCLFANSFVVIIEFTACNTSSKKFPQPHADVDLSQEL